MATPIVMPRLGDFMTEGIVVKWSKASGEQVTQGEVLAEIESEKLNYDLEATTSGVFHASVDEGATVAVDGVLGYLLAEGESPPETTSAPPAAPPASQRPNAPSRASSTVSSEGDIVPSTPGARRLAASLGVDLTQVTPTGPRGRIVDADVRAYHEQQQASSTPATSQTPPGMPTPSEVVPLQGMRRTIAHHMTRSLSSSAQLSYFLEVDVTDAQSMRREASRESDASIGLPHVLVKACAEALKRVPKLNSALHDDKIFYFEDINIGLAVALDDGLIVPVIHNVDSKNLAQIAKDADELSTKAREGGLSSHKVVGGTFTISVLGTVDGFTPILNQGQSAILGVGRSVQKPVVKDGEVVIREMMTVSLTADHQVIDGAVAASFLRRFQQAIERPAALFR